MLKYLSAVIALFLSTNVNSALVERLGGLAYYDTEADLTWLADANAVVGTIYDTNTPGAGTINHADAISWATSLNVGGVTGWRLPSTLQPDATCDGQSGGISFGINCTGSEMGNLFYDVMGGSAGTSIIASHNSNYDLFSNIVGGVYWSATEQGDDLWWGFLMYSGAQHTFSDDNFYAWAVQSGDVGVVPVPASIWLFGSGLLGLVGFARRSV